MEPSIKTVSFVDVEPYYVVVSSDFSRILHRGRLTTGRLHLMQISDDDPVGDLRYFNVGALDVGGTWIPVQLVGDEYSVAAEVVVFKAL
jgi:hypothetical protein